MICCSTCWCTVGLSIGTRDSTRRSRLRGIQSAEDMNTFDLALGIGSPLAKQTTRPCSRKRPTMLFTRMFSDRPGMPGLRQQMPRMTMSIRTPAWLAR